MSQRLHICVLYLQGQQPLFDAKKTLWVFKYCLFVFSPFRCGSVDSQCFFSCETLCAIPKHLTIELRLLVKCQSINLNIVYCSSASLLLPKCIKDHAGYSFHNKHFKRNRGGTIYTEVLNIYEMESKSILTALVVLAFTEIVFAVSGESLKMIFCRGSFWCLLF